jgi:hypothetical protein
MPNDECLINPLRHDPLFLDADSACTSYIPAISPPTPHLSSHYYIYRACLVRHLSLSRPQKNKTEKDDDLVEPESDLLLFCFCCSWPFLLYENDSCCSSARKTSYDGQPLNLIPLSRTLNSFLFFFIFSFYFLFFPSSCFCFCGRFSTLVSVSLAFISQWFSIETIASSSPHSSGAPLTQLVDVYYSE